jgi:hypothetical protein
MGDEMTFEQRLADAYVRYVEGVPVDVDAHEIARAAIAGAGGRAIGFPAWSPARLSPWYRRARLAVVAAVVLALTASVIWAVGVLLREPPPLPRLGPLWDMSLARVNPIVVTLDDGRVLIAGGGIENDDGEAPVVELLDPTTGTTTIIDGDTPSGYGTGVPLADGRVLVIAFDANHTCSSAFIVDPAAATSRSLPDDAPCNRPAFGVNGSAVRLSDGRVLLTGGKVDVYESTLSSAAVVFDPGTEAFTPTAPMSTPRIGHGMAVLGDGRVIVAGGRKIVADEDVESPGDVVSTVEIYDPAAGSFAAVGEMHSPWGATSALTPPDGRVLLVPNAAQGVREAQPTASHFGRRAIDPRVPIEVFDPATGRSSIRGFIPHPVSGAYLVSGGRVLVHGWVNGRVLPSGRLGAVDVGFAWAAVVDLATGDVVELPAPRTAMSSSAQLADGRVLLAGGLAHPPLNSRGRASGPPTVSPFIDVFD